MEILLLISIVPDNLDDIIGVNGVRPSISQECIPLKPN
jgi:hypothetical protein